MLVKSLSIAVLVFAACTGSDVTVVDRPAETDAAAPKPTYLFAISSESGALERAREYAETDSSLKKHAWTQDWSAEEDGFYWDVHAYDSCTWHPAGYTSITIDGRDGRVTSVFGMIYN